MECQAGAGQQDLGQVPGAVIACTANCKGIALQSGSCHTRGTTM